MNSNNKQFLPLVSICIPTYNGERFLSKTLESVIKQSYKNWEIVIQDDKSTDQTVAIAKNFKDQCSIQNIKISVNSNNLGMALNWNLAVAKASGKYIKVMGQDDLLDACCIARQVQILEENPQHSLVTCARRMIRPNGKPIFDRVLYKESQIMDEVIVSQKCLRFGGNFIGEPVAVLAKKEYFHSSGGFDKRFKYFIDVDMWIKIMKYGSIYFQKEALCSFRIHQNSVTFHTKNNIYAELQLLREVNKEIYKPNASIINNLMNRLRWEIYGMGRNLVYLLYGLNK